MNFNAIIQWGTLAFLPLYVWLWLATGVGFRRAGMRNGWVAGLSFLVLPINSVFILTRDQDRFEWFIMLVLLFSILVPVTAIVLLTYDIVKQTPFRYGANFLLFKHPVGKSELAPTPKQRLVILALTSCCLAVSIIGFSLYPCYWLDRLIGYSGCRNIIRFPGRQLADISINEGGSLIALGAEGTGIWNINTARLREKLPNEEYVRAVALSVDGQEVAVGGFDFDTYIYSLEEKRVIFTFPSSSNTEAIAFSPNKHTIALGLDNHIRIWDIRTKREVTSISVDGEVYSLNFSPNGQHLVGGGYDSDVLVWDTNTWKSRVLSTSTAYYVEVSPDNTLVAISGYNNALTLVKLENGALVRELLDSKPSEFKDNFSYTWQARFDKTGAKLVSGTGDGVVRIWDVQTGSVLARLQFKNDVRTVAFINQGSEIAIGLWDGTVRLWRNPIFP